MGFGFTTIVVEPELEHPLSSSIVTVKTSPLTIPTTCVDESSKLNIDAEPFEDQSQTVASPPDSEIIKVSSIQTGLLLVIKI